MFTAIKVLFLKWFQPSAGSELEKAVKPSSSDGNMHDDETIPINQVSDIEGGSKFSDLVPYDENLLERSRTQWQFGDWESLAGIDRVTLQHHPERAKLALLAAAGRLQLGQSDQASPFIRLALDWGCSEKLVAQILCSGVYNSLGCAAALAGRQDKAELSFSKAVALGAGGADVSLLKIARVNQQSKRLQIFAGDLRTTPQNERLQPIKNQFKLATSGLIDVDYFDVSAEVINAWIVGRWSFLSKLDNADLVTNDNKALLVAYSALGYQQLDDPNSVDRCTRLALEWGLPREALKKILGSGIRNTLAIAQVLSDDFKAASENFIASVKLGTRELREVDVKSRIRQQLKGIKEINQEKCIAELNKYIEEACVTKNSKGEK